MKIPSKDVEDMMTAIVRKLDRWIDSCRKTRQLKANTTEKANLSGKIKAYLDVKLMLEQKYPRWVKTK